MASSCAHTWGNALRVTVTVTAAPEANAKVLMTLMVTA